MSAALPTPSLTTKKCHQTYLKHPLKPKIFLIENHCFIRAPATYSTVITPFSHPSPAHSCILASLGLWNWLFPVLRQSLIHRLTPLHLPDFVQIELFKLKQGLQPSISTSLLCSVFPFSYLVPLTFSYLILFTYFVITFLIYFLFSPH